MSSRHKAREHALQILYQMDISKQSAEKALAYFKANFECAHVDLIFAGELAKGVEQNRVNIDQIIEQGSHNWKLSRMTPIDRNILRLATFELKYAPKESKDQPPTPRSVVINEAVEIAKKYGKDESGAFINGILDGIKG